MSIRRDHIVKWLDEDAIRSKALVWRDEYGADRDLRFDVVSFVQEALTISQREKITVQTFKRKNTGLAPAKVSFRPITLKVDERIWSQARLKRSEHYEYARHVIAHEIGHIVLHNDQEMAFSNPNSLAGRICEVERSAESQANIFARHFLAPDHIARQFGSVDEIKYMLGILIQLAIEIDSSLKRREYAGYSSFCNGCGCLVEGSRDCAACL